MTIASTVHVRATRAELRKLFARLPSWVSGARSGPPLVQQLQVRVGLSVLSLIQEAFIIKSRGGSDETGLRWAPLSPNTIAYSRKHPDVPKKKVRAKFAPSWMLTPHWRRYWWELVRAGHHPGSAWRIIKEGGARTLMMVYGGTKVDILRDTFLLFNSLSPAQPPDTAGTAPVKTPAQVFRLQRGEVIVGTSRKWAHTHHQGVPGRIPQRRLWPETSRWTARWWSIMLTQYRLGVIDIVLWMLRRGTT